MVMQSSKMKDDFYLSSTVEAPTGITKDQCSTGCNSTDLGTLDGFEESIENLMDGVLILTEGRELIYANSSAQRILRKLSRTGMLSRSIPKEICHLCQSLIRSRDLFPEQNWLIQSDIFTKDTIKIHIQIRWLKVESLEQSYLLLNLEDRHQVIQDIVIKEAQKYGLTPRERDVWVLHQANYNYKEIASELCITPNTVKKHMRSIRMKQKDALNPT